MVLGVDDDVGSDDDRIGGGGGVALGRETRAAWAADGMVYDFTLTEIQRNVVTGVLNQKCLRQKVDRKRLINNESKLHF